MEIGSKKSMNDLLLINLKEFFDQAIDNLKRFDIIQLHSIKFNSIKTEENAMNIYDFKVKAQDGSEVSLAAYKGKVLLVVNTATGCGFTPQYDELQDIYDEFKDKGLEILDFPCNQFGEQTPRR